MGEGREGHGEEGEGKGRGVRKGRGEGKWKGHSNPPPQKSLATGLKTERYVTTMDEAPVCTVAE